MNIDAAKTRRESLRWYIIKTLDTSRPVDPHEAVVLATIQGIYPDSTTLELRRELEDPNKGLPEPKQVIIGVEDASDPEAE